MSPKIQFAIRLKSIAGQWSELIRQSEDLSSVYVDRGYNSGGSNQITDEDITGHGISAADIAAFIAAGQQLSNLAKDKVTVKGAYQTTLNKVRGDI